VAAFDGVRHAMLASAGWGGLVDPGEHRREKRGLLP
jgi:hypothetical protein